MVSARWRGSCASGASGRPCATSQNGQRRVQMSPRIMKVAVPLPKHSAMFGHDASSHTVCSCCRRSTSLISWKRELGLAARTRIHAGLGSGAVGTMRIVLRAPFSLTPGSRILDLLHEEGTEALGEYRKRLFHPDVFGLYYGKAWVAAGIDRAERRQVHVDVQRKPMVGAPLPHANAERGDLGAADVDPGRAGPAFASAREQVDDSLLEERHELPHLDAAPREVDERVDDELPRAVIGDVAAAVGLDEGDAVRHRRVFRA